MWCISVNVGFPIGRREVAHMLRILGYKMRCGLLLQNSTAMMQTFSFQKYILIRYIY